MKNIVIGAFLFMACLSANAQIIQGNVLQQWIAGYERLENGGKAAADYDNSTSAMYYITGVAETNSNFGMICLPPGTTVGQMVSVVSKFLRENPEKWNNYANPLVAVALMRAFPCKK